MRDIQHPIITNVERTGFPYSGRREQYGVDGLGNEVFRGDEIFVLNDEFYLVEELFEQSIELLEQQGAIRCTAQ